MKMPIAAVTNFSSIEFVIILVEMPEYCFKIESFSHFCSCVIRK